MVDPLRTKDSLSREIKEARRQLAEALGGTAAGPVSDPAESDARYSYVLEQIGAMMVEMGPDRLITYASSTSESIQGYTAEEMIGDDWLDRVHPDDLGELSNFARQLSDPSQAAKMLIRIRHRDGHYVWLDTTVILRYLADGGGVRSISFTRDVSEIKNAERELRESEERYRRVADASRDIIAEIDAVGRLLYVSPSASETIGVPIEELMQQGGFDRVHPDDLEEARSTFTEGMASGRMQPTPPHRVLHGDGSWRWMQSAGLTYQRADGKTAYLIVTRDVTEAVEAEIERRELQERLQNAQKLESLGVMAGGIAHDFNNLLTPILGEASLAVADLPVDSPARSQAQKILKAAHRAASLTDQMLAYAGDRPLAIDSVDLGVLVDEMVRLLSSSAERPITFRSDLGDRLPRIEGDTSQISQVVMNLIANAAEAVAETGGSVAVRTGVANLDRGALGRSVLGGPLEPGRFVFVEVSDEGCGMAPDTLERIFDPFFTTKFAGRGLGLAAVLGIVRAHRGTIEIDTTPGAGTRIAVYLPPAADELRATPVEGAAPIGDWSAQGTVLVIDDDPGVRQLTEDTLARAGLSVLTAADGREGIETFRKHRQKIRLVLLDRTMPVTGGEEAFEAIRSIDSQARVILVSGYSEERAAGRIKRSELFGFLKKPFLPEVLLEMVRSVFQSEESSGARRG